MYVTSVARVTKGFPQPMYIGIDWLTLRFPRSIFPTIYNAVIAEQLREHDIPPQYFTKRGRQWENGVKLYGGLPDTHWIYVLDGQCLTDLYRSAFPLMTWIAQMIVQGANITRLDLAWDIMDKGELAQREALLWRDGKRVENRRKVKLVYKPEDIKGGCTLYEGSRSSDVFTRLYDKWAESKGTYPMSRFEAEIKGDAAKAITAHLNTALKDGDVKLATKELMGYFKSIIDTSATSMSVAEIARCFGVLDIKPAQVDIGRPATDKELWWTKSVIPAIVKDVLECGGKEYSIFATIERAVNEAEKAAKGG